MLTIGNLISSTISFKASRASTSINIVGQKIGIFLNPNYKAVDTKSMKRRDVMFNFAAQKESDATPYTYWLRGAVQIVGASSGGNYRVFILVPNVNVRMMKSNDFPITIGKHSHIKPMSTSSSIVKVRCDCHDFRWRFAYYNFQNGALYGATPPPYTPVAGSTRGPVNPRHLPGACKHIMAAFNSLREGGYFK